MRTLSRKTPTQGQNSLAKDLEKTMQAWDSGGGAKPKEKPHFKKRPIVSEAPITRYFVDVAKDDSVFAQIALAQKGFRCRDIHEENKETVRITIEDQTLCVKDIQAIFDAAAKNP